MSKKIDNFSAENCEKIKETIKLCNDKNDSYCLRHVLKKIGNLKVYCNHEHITTSSANLIEKNTHDNYMLDILQSLPPI